MIGFDFSYYRPENVNEAVSLFQQIKNLGKRPMYFSGGTEIITKSRAADLVLDAVIDIKDILECNLCHFEGEELVIGSGVTLTKAAEANLFPLLTSVATGVADHTSRNKITIGGNLCSELIFKEVVLPFLLSESDIVIAGTNGLRRLPIMDLFTQSLQLQDGELLVQLRTIKHYTEIPYFHLKRTKQTKIDYPLFTIAMMKAAQNMRLACSGLHAFPFRSLEVEKMLNNNTLSITERVHQAVSHLENGVIDDIQGSAEYRKFLFTEGLTDALVQMEASSDDIR